MRNKKTDQERILDEYLETWGAWRRDPITSLGYPEESVEARIQVDGRIRTVKTGRNGDWVEDDEGRVYIPRQPQKCTETRYAGPRSPKYDGIEFMARTIESAFHAIRNEQWQSVLIARYVRERKIGEISDDLQMAERTITQYLRDARNVLWGWIRRDVEDWR